MIVIVSFQMDRMKKKCKSELTLNFLKRQKPLIFKCRNRVTAAAGRCSETGSRWRDEGINLLSVVIGLWLPKATNASQIIPEMRNNYLKIRIKTALSRRQQGFGSPTRCQLKTKTETQKQALDLNRLGAFFCICYSFSCSYSQFLCFCGVEIDPKFGFNILVKTFADYPELAKQLRPSKNGSIRPELLRYEGKKKGMAAMQSRGRPYLACKCR
jgi:hypothetical protein